VWLCVHVCEDVGVSGYIYTYTYIYICMYINICIYIYIYIDRYLCVGISNVVYCSRAGVYSAVCVCVREREGVYMCVRMCVRVYVCARIRDAAGYKSSGV